MENQLEQRGGSDALSDEVMRLWHARGPDAAAALPDVVADSWRRCLTDHHLLPDSVPRADVLTHSQMNDLSENHADLLEIATPEIEKLFLSLMDKEYLVSLASPEGVMMLFRCDYQFLNDLTSFGVLPGSVWSEERQGTNGVGTCLRVGKPVTIVGSQHYGVAAQALTCLTAPVLGKFGAIESVLNVTTPHDGDERVNRLVHNVVMRSARRIENRYFSRLHRNSAILRLSEERDGADIADEARLAISDDGLIVAATSYLPRLTGMKPEDIIGQPAEQVLDFKSRLYELRPQRQFRLHVDGKEMHAALVEPSSGMGSRTARRGEDELIERPRPVHVVHVVHETPALTDLHLDTTLSMALGRAEKLLKAGLSLVVLGEAGTGKSTFAQIAARSAFGRSGVLTVVDCAMPSEASVSSAIARATAGPGPGAVIFDRIDQLDEAGQVALLSTLEVKLPQHDTRCGLIAATSADLDALAKEGRFRVDLLHRIRGAVIELTPVRCMPDLKGTIVELLRLECAALGKPVLALAEEARLVLCNYYWPGNTRELRHALRHAAALAEGQTIGLQHLPADIVSLIALRDLTARSQAESCRIEAALHFNDGNVTLTARHLGVSRATLYRRIQIQKMRQKV